MERRYTCWLWALFLAIVLVSPALVSPAGASSLSPTRLADTSTAVPHGSGRFAFFETMLISGDSVAFVGVASTTFQEGIYLFNGSTLRRVADAHTAIPNDPGSFALLGLLGISGDHVIFVGVNDSATQEGIYLFDGSTVIRVVDGNTAVPEGSGTFVAIGSAVISGDNVAFGGGSTLPDRGIYLFNRGTVGRVADTNTAVPNGSGSFLSFDSPVISGTNVAFSGRTAFGGGIYLFNGSILSRVADTRTAVPDSSGNFIFFLSPVISGNNVAFQAFGTQTTGIYLFNGSALSRVADTHTAMPNGSETFASFGDPVISGNNVAFQASGAFGTQTTGIYLFNGSALSRVADTHTAIPGGSGTFEFFSAPVISGDNVVFGGGDGSGNQGIYLFNGGTLRRVVDTSTAFPNGSGGTLGFTGLGISGDHVVFGRVGDSGFAEGIYLATTGVTAFSGTAQGLGRGSARTGIRILGTFQVDGTVNLETTTSVTITKLLRDGSRDVEDLPLILAAECCNNANTAYFKTAAGAVPVARVSIRDRGKGAFTFRIEVSKANSDLPSECPSPTLTTAFVLDGIAVSTDQAWLCFGSGSQYLESTR